jgi:predicted alpha/beta superfamily hydrolase
MPSRRRTGPGTQRPRGRVEVIRSEAGSPGPDRDLLVYVPPSYSATDRHYPVLYMQDGQNLFDPALSYAGSWRVDLAMDRAAARGLEGIIVGVPNAGEERISEYDPFSGPGNHAPGGERYLDHLVGSTKPLVDRRFRTLPGSESTGIAGSSMGGLISLFAFFQRTEVFGVAGALSPSLWLADRSIFEVAETAPFRPGRVYLDVGGREGAEALADVRRLRDLLQAKGFRPGKDLRYVEDRSGTHHESAWGRRFRSALTFLLCPVG